MKKNQKALLIEDNQISQSLFSLFFSELNWQKPTIVGNGEDALKMLETDTEGFDIILLDQKLPGISGLETFALAKKRFDNLPPFIMITGNQDFNLKNQAEEAGINGFIYKNELDLDLFQELINKILKES